MVTQSKLCKKITNTYVKPSSVKDDDWGKINRCVAQYPIGMAFALLANAAPPRSMFLRKILNFDNFNVKDLQTLNNMAVVSVHHSWCDSHPSGPHVVYDSSVWVNSAVLQLNPNFPGMTKHPYKLNINLVDYKEKNIKNEVNLTVQKKTNNLVKNLLPDQDADIEDTTIVFESCIYFDACWNQKFETKIGSFRPLHPNRPVQANFLTTKNKQYIRDGFYTYTKCSDPRIARFQVLSLPYQVGNESQFSMLVLLPNETDFHDRTDALPFLMNALAATEHTFLGDHFPKAAVEIGDFLLPRFTLGEADQTDKIIAQFACPPYDLTGMVRPAGNGITKNNPRRNNSSVGFSACYTEMNEHGTKLAGANATLVQETPTAPKKPNNSKPGSAGGGSRSVGPLQMSSSPPKRKTDFVADHPFLFFIRENKYGIVGSAGFVVNPNLAPGQT